jgi:hypothetical protein
MLVVFEFFANNYSYNKQETMQLTIPEALFFYHQTVRREKSKALEKITEWEALLAIATNPHLKASDAKKLPNELKKIKDRLENKQAKPQDIERGLEVLKSVLGSK